MNNQTMTVDNQRLVYADKRQTAPLLTMHKTPTGMHVDMPFLRGSVIIPHHLIPQLHAFIGQLIVEHRQCR